MANHFDKRLDPRLLVDDAKSVISLGLNYYTDNTQADPSAPKISKYAYGQDYHTVIKAALKNMMAAVQGREIPVAEFRQVLKEKMKIR